MAVYTPITKEQLQDFIGHYDAGSLKNFEGITQGVENTNYKIETDKGRFILTLFEKRVNPDDLPFFFAFNDHLAAHGIVCPEGVRGRGGELIRTLAGKPAALITFLDGKDVPADRITPGHCRSVGQCLARMHDAALSFKQSRANTLGLAGWKVLAERTAGQADHVEPGLAQLIGDELQFLERHWPDDLPRAVIHADLFPDNVFFSKQFGKPLKLTGVIDFYFACHEAWAYDLAICVNAWCFDERHRLVPERVQALMQSYNDERTMTLEEEAAFPLLLRGAALRFLLTRAQDWLFPSEGAEVTAKDPLEYLTKLQFFQTYQL